MRLKEFFIKIMIAVVIALVPLASVNFIIDPFQFYREHRFTRQVYFTDQRYQNPGLARSHDYSLAIIGTSMTDNFIPSYVEKTLGKKTIKLSMMGASAHEEKLTADVISREGKADTIIMELNYFSFRGAHDRVTHTLAGFPFYMYKNDPASHIQYLCNPDILLSSYRILMMHFKNKIHYTMVFDLEKLNTWYYNSVFSKENALKDWNMAQTDIERANPEEFTRENVMANARENIFKAVRENPKTEFILFYPPFSILAHKFLDSRDLFELQLDLKEYIYENLGHLPNVKIYDFQNIDEITHDLSNYRDMTHYNIHINEYMIKSIHDGKHLLTDENHLLLNEELRKQTKTYNIE